MQAIIMHVQYHQLVLQSNITDNLISSLSLVNVETPARDFCKQIYANLNLETIISIKNIEMDKMQPQ